MKGKFIAIEGIDGAGGETQSKLLLNYLKGKGVAVIRLAYPDYGGPIGKTIHTFLHKKIDLPKQIQFMLYVSDMLKDVPKIRKFLAKRWVIADRWFGSTLAYQCGKEVPVRVGLSVAKLLNLPTPDLNIYLRVSPTISIERKIKEKGGRIDRYESNRAFLEGVSKNYSVLIKNGIFGKWAVIDAEQPIKKVFEDIRKVLKI